MTRDGFLKIGITCYPTVGGSGILACALGEDLARRGHEVHFISYDKPFRMPEGAVVGCAPGVVEDRTASNSAEHAQGPLPLSMAHRGKIFFHPVVISDYGLFKYPDYTLPLSVKMAEVTRDFGLDILHVHYAVPHATAAILARSMLPVELQPKVVTTLHGTDTTLLGRDPGYGPAIRHALACSDAITTVSEFLKRETVRLIGVEKPIDVIHNFFDLCEPVRSREEVRREVGLEEDEVMLLHCSNLRSVKRIDLLLETAAKIWPRQSFKLVVLAGDSFAPFAGEVKRLGLEERVVVREKVDVIEDYLQAADVGLYTSETESFCLAILEAMWFACPSVAMRVGGIPEVVEDGETGVLVPFGDIGRMVSAVEALIRDKAKREEMGAAGRRVAHERFSAAAIVPQYEALYRRVCMK